MATMRGFTIMTPSQAANATRLQLEWEKDHGIKRNVKKKTKKKNELICFLNFIPQQEKKHSTVFKQRSVSFLSLNLGFTAKYYFISLGLSFIIYKTEIVKVQTS